MSLARKQDFFSILLLVIGCNALGGELEDMRDVIASSICDNDVACYEMAMEESTAVDSMITIAQNSISAQSNDYNSNGKTHFDELRQWTLDFSEGSLEEYIERLQLATIQVQPTVHAAMNRVVAARPVMLKSSSMVLPNELTKTQQEDAYLKEQDAKECVELCKMGTEPAEIQSCIEYCERLVQTTVELQKYALRQMRPNALLFQGIHEHHALN